MQKELRNYFPNLNQELKAYKRAVPSLIVDLDKLDQNIDQLMSSLRQKNSFRIVVKSLPSLGLINYLMEKTGTHKLMLFHQAFLSQIARDSDEKTDILLGKPMPIKTASYFYESLKLSNAYFDPFSQIQWLLDTPKRIEEYVGLAKSLGKTLRVNLELDVGLHRGGFPNLEELRAALALCREHKTWIQFSGFMGYDPHVVKLPAILRSAKKALRMANDFYAASKGLLKNEFPDLWQEQLTFNGAGSPTASLHKDVDSPLNDISVGSALVKPSTFDIPSLEQYQPASFIASPVLKKFKGTQLPALEGLKGLLNLLSNKNKNSYFIYGGYWKADYVFPLDIQQNAIFGPSTNQTMLNAPPSAKLEVDDFVFLRPQQSEFVFLQFGNILCLRNGKIVGDWEVLKND